MLFNYLVVDDDMLYSNLLTFRKYPELFSSHKCTLFGFTRPATDILNLVILSSAEMQLWLRLVF